MAVISCMGIVKDIVRGKGENILGNFKRDMNKVKQGMGDIEIFDNGSCSQVKHT